MNRAQMVAPFAEEELRTFKGRGGKTMTFIEDETVMDRLDAGYGYGNWQLLVDNVPTDPGVVKVRLGVRENGEWTWYEDYGYPNQPDGDVLKEAVSDGIRRCGRYVGIARDLYRKSTYEPGGALGPKAAAKAELPTLERMSEGGLIGIATKQPKMTTDFNVRQSKEGPFLGFRLKENANDTGYICETRGTLAEALKALEAEVVGKRVQVWGTWVDYAPPLVEHSYRAFRVERLQTPDFTLPASEASGSPGNPEVAGVGDEPAPAAPDPELDALPLFADVA